MIKLTNSILTALTLLLCCCDKLPTNGELDGQWQLMQIEEKGETSEGGTSTSYSTKEQRIYWAFQLDLLNIYTQLGNLNGHTPNTVGRFQHANGKLELPEFYIHFHNRDSLLTDPNTTALEHTGIRGNRASFQVELLNSKSMILSSDYNRLTFRKF